MLVLKFSARGFNDADFVGSCIVSGRTLSATVPGGVGPGQGRPAVHRETYGFLRRCASTLALLHLDGSGGQLTYANLAPILTT